jgi:hypothetical protein
LSNNPFEFELWSIETTETKIEEVKYFLHSNISTLSEQNNITHIGHFQGLINESNKKLEIVSFLNKKYTLEFRVK